MGEHNNWCVDQQEFLLSLTTRTTQYRYHELSRCVRQWRHLKMAKRGGSGYLCEGISATAEGSLAIDCPACPHPGLNAPSCLDEMPEEKRSVVYYYVYSVLFMLTYSWLHALFLAIDANFRLRLKNRGINDPELGSGWSYFVETTSYEKHLKQHFGEGEVTNHHLHLLSN
jgi:hypothetical protein